MSDCLFCSLYKEREVVLENGLAYAVRDAFPVTPYHTLVIPFRHFPIFFDISYLEMSACLSLINDLRQDLVYRDGDIRGFNVGVNVGTIAGQTIFHCHFHLIPRRAGDVEGSPRGGVRNILPGKGDYNYRNCLNK